MSFEEDTYSRIFTALKHPVRRKILAILGEEHLTYTGLLNRLGVETGFLNYHLENLSGLITKDEEGMYRLSEFGSAARSLTSGIEAPVKKRANSLNIFGHHVEGRFITVGLVLLLVLSNAFFVYTVHSQSIDRANTVNSSLTQSRSLVIESIVELNRTISGGDIGYGDLDTIQENMVKLTSQCRFLAETDPANKGGWTHIADAFEYLSGFALQLNQQHFASLLKDESTQLSWLKVDTLSTVRDDLTKMLVAFPSNNTSGQYSFPSVSLDFVDKLTSDARYSKVVFGLGELFKGP